MSDLQFSRGRNINDNHPQRLDAAGLAGLIKYIERDRAAAKEGAAYICGPLKGDGRRSAENAQPRSWVAVDLDRIEAERLADVRAWFMRFAGCGWPTHSSKSEAPRERVIIELDRKATRDECMAIGRALVRDLADEFGAAVLVDESTFRPEQPVFVPPVAAVIFRFDGEALDVDRYVESAPGVARSTVTVDPQTGEIGGKVQEGGRHAHLRRRLATLNWRGIPEAGIRASLHEINEQECDPPKPREAVDALVDDWRRYGSQHGRDLAQVGAHALPQANREEHPATLPAFAVVPVADLAHVEPDPPSYWWDKMLPAGVVTLLGAHGGTGKSTIALMLAVCITTGLALFGVPTRRGKVAFFSGEDDAELVRYRLRLICKALGVSPAELENRLHVLDATGGDPTLFHEVGIGGRRQGLTTPSYAALREYVEQHAVDVLMVDNASDAFDASEIDRAKVRAFMRALATIARARGGAVLLLAHVDKGTSRGDRTGTEGYSGSTAWHNSARSRLFLTRDKDGALLLEQQKLNLGKMADPLRLLWPEGGMPMLDGPVEGFVQHIADSTDTKALLKLLHEFSGRGEFVAPSPNSPANAARVLSGQRGYPKRKPAEVFDLLRDAERRGLIERQERRTVDRKAREVWGLTKPGCDLIGVPAPSAPSAPTPEPDAPGAASAGGAPSAPTPGAGGVGGGARAQKSAQGASA